MQGDLLFNACFLMIVVSCEFQKWTLFKRFDCYISYQSNRLNRVDFWNSQDTTIIKKPALNDKSPCIVASYLPMGLCCLNEEKLFRWSTTADELVLRLLASSCTNRFAIGLERCRLRLLPKTSVKCFFLPFEKAKKYLFDKSTRNCQEYYKVKEWILNDNNKLPWCSAARVCFRVLLWLFALNTFSPQASTTLRSLAQIDRSWSSIVNVKNLWFGNRSVAG